MKKKTPTLTIITICYNIKDEIERTCKSIIDQTWQDFEWIVVDGGSTDGTVDVLKKYANRIDVLISEPDKGIYNAMNKGIKLAHGEWLNFMNGGDCFAANDVLEKVFKNKEYDADVLYGNINLVQKDGNKRLVTFPQKVDKIFFYKSYIAHPASFIKRTLFDEFGLYNEKYRIVSDWEKWIIFSSHRKKFLYLDLLISDFAVGGISDTNRTLTLQERSDVIKQLYSANELSEIQNRKKILVVSQPQVTHVIGGAITVFNDFCNMLSDNYDVIGCCSSDINVRPQGLYDSVKFVNFYFQYRGKNYSQAFNLLMAAEKPDLIVFFFPTNYIIADLNDKFKSIPRILMFHSRPDWYSTEGNSLNMIRNIYKNTTAQILLPSFYNLLPDFIKKGNVVCIPNYVKQTDIRQNPEKEKKKIVYLSRIDSAKGHEFLIRSFALIAHKYPDWQLDIYGQSTPPEYEKILKKQVKKLKLVKQIHFMGITQTPLEVLQNYDFCVFPSWFEGWGLGLTDAQSVGLPAIGFKGCSGVNELIIDGKNGFLADDNIEDFAQKIELLITNKTLRKKMSKEAFSGTLQYSVEDWAEKWNNVITAILSKKKIPYQIKQDCNCPYEIFTLEKIQFIQAEIQKDFKIIYRHYEKKYRLFGFIPLLKIEEK